MTWSPNHGQFYDPNDPNNYPLAQLTPQSQDSIDNSITYPNETKNTSSSDHSFSAVTPQSVNRELGDLMKVNVSTTSTTTKKLSRSKYLSTKAHSTKSKRKFSAASNVARLPTREEVSSSQSTMTQQFMTRSEMRAKKEYNEKMSYIKKKPHTFDPRDEVPDKTRRTYTRSDEKYNFERFLRFQAKRAKVEEESLSKSTKRELLKNDPKDQSLTCKGCGFKVDKCQNKKFGRYCVNAVRAYYYGNKDTGTEPLEICARKVFIDHYHYASHYDAFVEDGTGNIMVEVS